jgi:hypothetical protein
MFVPGLKLPEQPSGVGLAPDDHVIEELAADRPDETLDVAVHSRRSDRSLDGADPETPNSAGELLSIGSVAVSDQELRSGVPRKSVDGLLAEPEGGRVRRHVREDEAPALEGENNEDAEDLESDCRDREEIDSYDPLRLVTQKGLPGLRTGSSRFGSDPFEIPGDRPFAHVEAELEELAMNPRRAPGRVLYGHSPNQPSDLGTSARTPALRLPSPEEAERLAMPGDDGLGFDDDEALSPARKAVENEGPEGSVPRGQGKVGWLRPEEDTDLMAKGQVLGDQGGARTKKGAEGAESESNEAEHRERIRSEGKSIPPDAQTRFWRGTPGNFDCPRQVAATFRA